MLLLNRSDVRKLLTINDALDAMEAGFRALHEGKVRMPLRLALETPPQHVGEASGLHLSMPAYVESGEGERAMAIKIVTVYPDNPARHGLPTIQGVVLLHDAATGAPLALLDAEELTAVRTGAASGVATRHLALPDAHTLLMIGAGALAPAQIEAVCAVRPIRKVWVASRTGKGDRALCQWVEEHLGVTAAPVEEMHAAVESSQVICTATNAAEPLFDGAWLRPGTHLNLVGAYTRRLREVDAGTIRHARVFVDRLEAARAEAGDIVQAAQELGLEPESLIAGELGAVVAGDLEGRTSPGQITIFKSVGMAMQDVVTASRVYARARALGIGTELDLSE